MAKITKKNKSRSLKKRPELKARKTLGMPEANLLWVAISELIDHAVSIESGQCEQKMIKGQREFILEVLNAKSKSDRHFRKYILNAQRVVMADRLTEVYRAFPDNTENQLERKNQIETIAKQCELMFGKKLTKGEKLRLHAPLKDSNDPEDINFNFRGAKVNAYDRLGDIFDKGSKSTLNTFKKTNLNGYESGPALDESDVMNHQKSRLKSIFIHLFKVSTERAETIASVLNAEEDFKRTDPFKEIRKIIQRLVFDSVQ
ncbi:MAG TPA: hypothetical protein VIG33_07685 [Pseudobdellovibrionaceae bacterium]|jgi:hypothetical protein